MPGSTYLGEGRAEVPFKTLGQRVQTGWASRGSCHDSEREEGADQVNRLAEGGGLLPSFPPTRPYYQTTLPPGAKPHS